MAVKKPSIVVLQSQLYSVICQMKVLSRAFDAVCEAEVDKDEVNGLTEGFSDVVDKLIEVSGQLDGFNDPVERDKLAKITHLYR